MKAFVTGIVVLILLSSCDNEEKIGICTAHDGEKIAIVDCESNFTKAQCAQYNKDEVDGYRWSFVESTTLCPVAIPTRD